MLNTQISSDVTSHSYKVNFECVSIMILHQFLFLMPHELRGVFRKTKAVNMTNNL